MKKQKQEIEKAPRNGVIEKELVMNLKESYPDLLEFNNNLGRLELFWKESKEKDVLKIIDEDINRIKVHKKYWENDKDIFLRIIAYANQLKQKIKSK